MFRKEDDFDDVAKYKKQREVEIEEGKGRLDKKDDYDLENREVEEKNQFPKKSTVPRQNTNKNGDAASVIIFLIIGFIIMGIFISISQSEMTYQDYEYSESESIDYNDFLGEIDNIYAKEFVGEYNNAKKNKIEYNKSTREYVKGNYEKSHIVNTLYVQYEYSESDENNYLCLIKTYNYDESEIEYDNILSCGFNETNIDLDNSYPLDFIKAIKENNESGSDYIDLDNYSIENSEYKEVYYINGYYYSKEFCEYVSDWIKTGKL